jgi:hypothetical protein
MDIAMAMSCCVRSEWADDGSLRGNLLHALGFAQMGDEREGR